MRDIICGRTSSDVARPRPPARLISRHAWMSVTMMPRAPSSHSSSMTALRLLAPTIERTADQPCSCSGDTVGDSMPGVIATAWSTRSSLMS